MRKVSEIGQTADETFVAVLVKAVPALILAGFAAALLPIVNTAEFIGIL